MPRLPLLVTLPIKEPLRQVWRYQEFELQTILTVLPSKIRKYLHCRQSSTPLRSAMASLPQGLERSKSRLVTFCISARFVLAKSCETLCRHGLDWPLGSAERWWSMDTHWPAELGGQGWKHISCFFFDFWISWNQLATCRKRAISVIKKVIKMSLVESGQGILYCWQHVFALYRFFHADMFCASCNNPATFAPYADAETAQLALAASACDDAEDNYYIFIYLYMYLYNTQLCILTQTHFSWPSCACTTFASSPEHFQDSGDNQLDEFWAWGCRG